MPKSRAVLPLEPHALRRSCDPAGFSFATTEELEEFAEVLGQSRAVEAIRFASASSARRLQPLRDGSRGHRAPYDRAPPPRAARHAAPDPARLVLRVQLEAPDQPRAMSPSGGQRRPLSGRPRAAGGGPAHRHPQRLRGRTSTAPPCRRSKAEFEKRHEGAIEAVGAKAKDQGIALVRTPSGFGFAPLRMDKVMSPDEFHALSERGRRRCRTPSAGSRWSSRRYIQEVPKMRREAQHKVRVLNRAR